MKDHDPFPIRLCFYREGVEVERVERLDGPADATVVADFGALRVQLATNTDGGLIRGEVRSVETVRPDAL